MEETNTTGISLFNVFLYDGAHGRNRLCCESQTFTVDFVALFGWDVWFCRLLGNVVVMWFLVFHMKRSPFTVCVLNLAIADFPLIPFFVCHLRYTVKVLGVFICLHFPDVIFTAVYLLFFFCYLSSMYDVCSDNNRCEAMSLCLLWYQCHHHNHLSGIVWGVLCSLPGLFICLSSICCNFYQMSVCCNIFRGADFLSSLIFSTLPLLSSSVSFIKLQCCSLSCPPGRLYIVLLLTCLFFIFAIALTVEHVLEVLVIEHDEFRT